MFAGDMKFIDWEKVDLSKNGGRQDRSARRNSVWLRKSRINKLGVPKYRRIVGISKHLLDEVGFGSGTELILLRNKDIFAFKKVRSHGQFKINAAGQIQNQPLYLELMSKAKDNVFDAFAHDGMIVFHAPVDEVNDGLKVRTR